MLNDEEKVRLKTVLNRKTKNKTNSKAKTRDIIPEKLNDI
jgi:hypothetical protein